MKIIGASLVDRFHTHNGWTRSAVAECLESKNIHKVIPRWLYDDEQDRLIFRRGPHHVIEDCEEYLDCDYYAVYDFSERFDQDIISEHEYIPINKNKDTSLKNGEDVPF